MFDCIFLKYVYVCTVYVWHLNLKDSSLKIEHYGIIYSPSSFNFDVMTFDVDFLWKT